MHAEVIIGLFQKLPVTHSFFLINFSKHATTCQVGQPCRGKLMILIKITDQGKKKSQ